MARVGASLESEWEMRDAARPGSKRWALGNWDLRWKVTAVLAVPLAVAVGLGVSRITAEFSNAQRLEAVAENIEAIPAVTGLSAASATVAGSQLVSLNGQTVVTDKDLSDLDEAITRAQSATSKLKTRPESRAMLENMITEASALRTKGKAPAATSAESIDAIDRIRNFSVRIVETTVSQVSDTATDSARLRLVDALNTRATVVGELAAFAEILKRQPDALQNFLVASATERQMLNVLAHRFPDGDTAIADLRAGVQTRVDLITSPEAQAGRIPLGESKASMTGSVDVYERVVAKATKDIETSMNALSSKANTDAWTYTAVVIATILAALLLAVFVARSMIVPLHRLRLAALRVAESDLPHEVSQLRAGASPEDVPLEPMPVRSTEEIGQLARAVDDIHGQALRLASDQAQMRSQVNDMFETLARRSKSLVDHQLSLIEAMEYDEKDPRLLENLFRLDHLAARMRRNGDNLLILAGTKQRRAKSAPVEIADVLRAAISEVEDYERVKLGATPRGSLKEPAASDMAHLFAELLDNALRASPPETDVKFTFAQAHDQGMLIEVADRGNGMPPAEMSDINRRLEQTAEPGPDTARHMGLFVVGRLAERHGLTVRLRPTFDTARDPGVTVTVHVPVGLIVAGQPISAQPVTPSPVQQSPKQAGPQRPSTGSSMQTRAVTRTPGGNMMVTVDPGVSGPIPITKRPGAPTPSAAGGLPQRQPGSAMSQGADQAQSGPTLRPTPGQTPPPGPQRGKLAAANMPKRNLGPGGPGGPAGPGRPGGPGGPGGPRVIGPGPVGGAKPPSREPASGELPQRQPGANGVPAAGGPASAGGGLPQRQPGANGAPTRDPAAGGLPQRPMNGMPPREPTVGGLPTREPGASGLPTREPGAQIPQGLPQRQPAANQPREGAPTGGLPTREPLGGGLPQREPGASGLPTRSPGANGAPSRDAGPGGLPQRQPGGLPQREPASGALPTREPGAQTPTGLPQRQPAVSQRLDSPSGGLPTREPLGNGLPQRQPGAQTPTGLPQRSPGANGPRREVVPPGVGLPQSDRLTAPSDADAGDTGQGVRDPGKHSYRSNPAKAASFFQTRLQPAAETGATMDSPIFAEMMSSWLSDPNPDRSQVAAAFDSPGDEGWQAARRASEAQAETKTAAGLPQRNPGGRLVPGAVNGAVDRAPRRDPESIRSSLSRHQKGVQDGRSMKAPNLTGDKGDR